MGRGKSLREAVKTGKAVFFSNMSYGKPSREERQQSYEDATESGQKECVEKGHDWYVDTPQSLQFELPYTGNVVEADGEVRFEKQELEFPENPVWACFCDRCGFGSYFETLPECVFDHEYWCYSCESRISGSEVIPHMRQHFDERGFWPTYSTYQNQGEQMADDGFRGGLTDADGDTIKLSDFELTTTNN